MTQIWEQIDELVCLMKLTPGLDGVRFVREYGSHDAELPVRGFLAVVCVENAAVKRGFLGSGASQTGIPDALYSADTELRVYAPAGENGAGLSGVISEMLRALELFDERRIVTKREVGSIEFDSDLGAIFRRLRFRVEFCLCEEG